MSANPRALRFGPDGVVLGSTTPPPPAASRENRRPPPPLDVRGVVAFAALAITVGPWLGLPFALLVYPPVVVPGLPFAFVVISLYSGSPGVIATVYGAALPVVALTVVLMLGRCRQRGCVTRRWAALAACAATPVAGVGLALFQFLGPRFTAGVPGLGVGDRLGEIALLAAWFGATATLSAACATLLVWNVAAGLVARNPHGNSVAGVGGERQP